MDHESFISEPYEVLFFNRAEDRSIMCPVAARFFLKPPTFLALPPDPREKPGKADLVATFSFGQFSGESLFPRACLTFLPLLESIPDLLSSIHVCSSEV